jgi:hypothetical protein
MKNGRRQAAFLAEDDFTHLIEEMWVIDSVFLGNDKWRRYASPPTGMKNGRPQAAFSAEDGASY